MMKANAMRAPLIKAGVVLLVFALLAYLTSASPDGGVLDSLGLIIIGAFRLVQWAIAMTIGVAVCIAFLIGIFLFAVSLYDRQAASVLAAKTREAVSELLAPVFALVDSLRKQPRPTPAVSTPAPAAQPLVQQPAAPAVDATKLQDELQTLIASEIRKVADSQQSLSDQFAALNAKIDVLEEKTAGFAAADQVSAIADQIAASGQRLDTVQASVASLEARIDDTARSLQDLTPAKLLGDLPGRLEKLEQRPETPAFDPQPLTESIQTLQHEVEELRKKGAGKPQAAGKSRKKA